MDKAALGKIVFITLATVATFSRDFASFTSKAASYEWLGYYLVTPLALAFAVFTLRRRLSFVAKMKSGSMVGVLFLAASLALYAVSSYSAGFLWLRSIALVGFVTGLTALLFNPSLVRILAVPLLTIGLFIPPPLEVNVATFLAMLLFIASVVVCMPRGWIQKAPVALGLLLPVSLLLFGYGVSSLPVLVEAVGLTTVFFLWKRGAAKVVGDSCSPCTETVYQGVEFCIRCGRSLTAPKSHLHRRDIVVMLSVSILLATTARVNIPVFASYEGEPTVWASSLFGYEDVGLFNPHGYLSAKLEGNSSSSTYFIEGSGVNATLKIFADEDSFTQELRNLQVGQKVLTTEPVGRSPSARYLLLDGQGETTSVVYSSAQPYFISLDGFVPIDIGFIIESSGNLTLARNYLEGVAEAVAGRWSAAGWLSDILWRSWQIYIRLSDYLPIILAGVLLFALAYTARRRDGEVERRVEYASNMAPSYQLLLACVTSAASKTGSASGFEVEVRWRQISPSERYGEARIERLERFARLDLVEKSLGRDGVEPVLRWKPRFPHS